MINEGKEIDEEPTNSSAIYLVELNKETGYLEQIMIVVNIMKLILMILNGKKN